MLGKYRVMPGERERPRRTLLQKITIRARLKLRLTDKHIFEGPSEVGNGKI